MSNALSDLPPFLEFITPYGLGFVAFVAVAIVVDAIFSNQQSGDMVLSRPLSAARRRVTMTKTTRRTALAAGAAALFGGAAKAAEMMASDCPALLDDAKLVRLSEEYQAAFNHWWSETSRLEKMRDDYTAAASALPQRAAVTRTEQDLELGLYVPWSDSSRKGWTFTKDEVERLRTTPRRRRVERAPLPSDNLPSDAEVVVTSVPWPEAQARADQIVAAYDEWVADIDRLDASFGFEEQDARVDALLQRERDLIWEIASTPATTLAGLAAKVRALNASTPIAQYHPSAIEPELTGSILSDLARMTGLDVPEFRACPDGFERHISADGSTLFKAA